MANEDDYEPDLREVLFEFRRVGTVVRVSALDPQTNTEVWTVAPKGYGMELIKRLAMRKLRYVMKRRYAEGARGQNRGLTV